MANSLNTRIQQKHDIEVNWLKATNFIPLMGEIIIYDPDDNYNEPRIKIGDGITNINALPFATKNIDTTLTKANAAADAQTVGDRLKPTRIQDFKALGPLTTLGDHIQDSAYIFVDYLDWPEEDRAAFLLEGKRYPLIIGGKTYLAYTKNGGENVGLYLGNPALSYNDNLKALGDSGEDFVIYRYPDPTDVSSPYIFLGYKESLGGTNIQFFYPVSDQVIDELGIIEDDLAAVPKSLVPTNLQNGIAEGSLRTIGSIEESDNYKLGKYSVAEGYLCKAPGNWAHAEGYRTQANGNDSHAENFDTIATGKYSHAEGYLTRTESPAAHAEGQSTVAYGHASHAEGTGVADGTILTITGAANTITYSYTASISHFGPELNSIIIYSPTAIAAKIIGVNLANSTFTVDHTLSVEAIEAGTDFSIHAYGIALGRASHAENSGRAVGEYSHAENHSIALGTYSHSENGSTALGTHSHAEGTNGLAKGERSHVSNGPIYGTSVAMSGAALSNSYNLENYSLKVGQVAEHNGVFAKIVKVDESSPGILSGFTVDYPLTLEHDLDGMVNIERHVANGVSSTVMGQRNIANGESSFSGGYESIIDGNYSFGWGEGLSSLLANNFNIGRYNIDNDTNVITEKTGAVIYEDTTKTWDNIFAKVIVTTTQPTHTANNVLYTITNPIVKTIAELAAGDYLIIDYSRYFKVTSVNVMANYGLVQAQGTTHYLDYGTNTKGSFAFVIGNGDRDEERSNAHTVDWDGNAWYSGDVYVGSNSGTNKDAGSKKLATEEFVLQNSGSNVVVSSTAPNNPAVGTIWFQI